MVLCRAACVSLLCRVSQTEPPPRIDDYNNINIIGVVVVVALLLFVVCYRCCYLRHNFVYCLPWQIVQI